MELEEAKALLNICDRWENRDHYFGDREVGWTFGGEEVASGYFGGGHKGVSIYKYQEGAAKELLADFDGAEAYELVSCGQTAQIGRNDSQGNNYPFERYRGA